MKAAVIGSPISHTLSPAIFAFISQDQGVAMDYTSIEVMPEAHQDFFRKSQTQKEFIGFNVTLPLKEHMMKLTDSLSPAAKAMGALNVIHFSPDGSMGHNTDAIGIEKTFSRMKKDLKASTCLLFGAGGSAKACAFVLGEQGAKKVFVLNRGERGAELVTHFASLFPHTHFQAIASVEDVSKEIFSVMINSTPLGMQGKDSGETYFKAASALTFTKDALAFDLIYVPEKTDFLKMAQSSGLKTVGGLGMLIDQALATWEIWIAPLKNEEHLHQRLKPYLKGILKLRHDPSPVFLTGFMGVGKSSVGKKLSELTQREFLDTDHIIESIAQKKISEIFSEDGEEGFRSYEKKAVLEISQRNQVIVSLGGGSLTQEDNLKAIHAHGIVVYLEADPKTLEKRITDQGLKRPLLDHLQGAEKTDQIRKLLEKRKAAYEKAPIMISTGHLSCSQVCFEILSKIGEKA